MNYYIQGNKEKADQIKAAFGKYVSTQEIAEYDFSQEEYLFYTGQEERGTFVYAAWSDSVIAEIIKTHPDYKELELPVEPMFKVGDWLYHNTCGVRPILVKDYSERRGYKVECIGIAYYLQKGVVEKEYHLWTIEDVIDGDVLALNGKPFIYSSHKYGKNYCYIDEWGQLRVNFSLVFEGNYVCPATKQERDLLFSKMREVGYEWDADKKELRKIKPHYDISNFKPFDKVLVRCSNDEEWMIEFYCKYDTLVHTSPHRDYPFMGIGDSYSQCIPYEGNEHLFGTTDIPSEEFINW